MIPLLRHFVGWLVGAFRSREDLMLENLVLRQQLLALHAKTNAAAIGLCRQGVLGGSSKAVVWVEETVPARHPRVLYCFFVIDHDRRKILHLNVSQNPSAPWVAPQLRQTWAYDQPQRFLIFDRDAKF